MQDRVCLQEQAIPGGESNRATIAIAPVAARCCCSSSSLVRGFLDRYRAACTHKHVNEGMLIGPLVQVPGDGGLHELELRRVPDVSVSSFYGGGSIVVRAETHRRECCGGGQDRHHDVPLHSTGGGKLPVPHAGKHTNEKPGTDQTH